jgi:hypothetical protein
MVGMGVGVAVGVAVGVLVGVAVLVGTVVAVGNDVALGAGIGIGADTGAQADNIRLTSKNTSTVRFILRVLLRRSSRPTIGASAAARSEAERCRLDARVMRPFVQANTPTMRFVRD